MTQQVDLKQALRTVEDFLRQTGQEIVESWSSVDVVSHKDKGRDVATNFDIDTEKAFSDLVMKHFPDHGFLGEDCPELNRE